MHTTLSNCLPCLSRRSALAGIGAALSIGTVGIARASTTSTNHLVIVNIKGGLDGLSVAAPYGDANLAKLRASLMAPGVGKAGGMLDLGGFYGLHPALQNFYAMYKAHEALVIHAVGNAGASRSHFQGQDFLQSGEPLLLSTGWVNRLANFISGNAGGLQSVVNMGLIEPLLVQGPAVTAGWSPPPFPALSTTMMNSILTLTQPDALLGPATNVSFSDSQLMSSIISAGAKMPAGLSSAAMLAWRAGELLASASGPRVATITLDSVDTHDAQVDRLNTQLPDIDSVFWALKSALGAAWSSTVVLTMTEFGRTAAANGTGGTDHGTGFAVLMAGGAVAGGKVVATWPGLAASQLFEGRDLQPTVDFRSVAASILSAHLGVSSNGLGTIFPAGYGSFVSGLLR